MGYEESWHHYPSTAEVTLPATFVAPTEVAIRFGLCPTGTDGRRFPTQATMDHEGPARGGRLHLKNATISWHLEPPDPAVVACSERLNMRGS